MLPSTSPREAPLAFPPSTSPREALLACPPSLPWNLPSITVESTLSSSCSRSDLPLSCQGAALAQLDSLPPHDLVLWTDSSVPFPFEKGGSGALANCSLCGTETTLFLFSRPSMLKFFRWSLGHSVRSLLVSAAPTALPLLFSPPPLWLSFCPRHLVRFSIFPFTSDSLAGTVFSLLRIYQATMGPQTFVSPGERRSWWAGQMGSATCALRNPL